jgi:prolyl-tRNA editing enzyme YbaK/EbsC (Cys-tRNA(Pro) deacylase)
VHSDTASSIRHLLKAAGVAGDVREFPEPVPTADAAAAALGCDTGAIANSLVFEADGAALLVLASGAHRVHPGRLARRLGTGKIRRAAPDYVLAHTGRDRTSRDRAGHSRADSAAGPA